MSRRCLACSEGYQGFELLSTRSNKDEGPYRATYCGTEHRIYNAQVAWNKAMERLYADRGRSVRTASPPPSYRTQAQVTARCRERGSRGDADIVAALRDRTFAKAYRDFLTALGLEGRHRPPLGQPASRWRVVPLAIPNGGSWALRLASEMRLVVERFVKTRRAKGWAAVQEGDGSPAIDEAFEREANAGGWVRLRDLNYKPYVTETAEVLRTRYGP